MFSTERADFMGFSWNGIHTSELGILAEAQTLPILPEPKIITEEVAGKDGFYDFSAYNSDGRVRYMFREWEYKCSFDSALGSSVDVRIAAVGRLFSSYSGYLVDDKCKNVRWNGTITNRISLTQVARTLHSFAVFIKTQPFAEGLERIILTHSVDGLTNLSIVNVGTWYVRPDVYLTGQANNMTIGTYKLPFSGLLDNQLAYCPELEPDENNIQISGFSGLVRFEFIPLYIWDGAV